MSSEQSMIDAAPSDDERYPTLTEHGAAMLRFMREHPNAPIFRNQSGNRLTRADIERVRAFEREVAASKVEVRRSPPAWVGPLLEHCYAEVPYYRKQGAAPPSLEEIVSVRRSHFARDIAAFVPDSEPVARLINFRTTGTTGHPLLLASHPVVAANYLSFHKRAFQRFGVQLRHRRGQVGVLLLGFQKKCFTYVSVTPTMDDSGLCKLNLHPDDWREPTDRGRYLEALGAEVIAGDPISFAELLRTDVELRPRILLCTAMSLSRGLRSLLEERFQCPVADVYSLNEAGPIAVYDEAAGGHVLLQHCMYVELLGEDDHPVADGERGEITLTGGFNFCLPLLRYRTGDFARWGRYGDEPVLLDLQGRAPVVFETSRGQIINNIDVTHALAPLPIAQYALHQHGDGALTLSVAGFVANEAELRERMLGLFGAEQQLEIQLNVNFEGKTKQYSSDLAAEA